jgi:hypothetical protein
MATPRRLRIGQGASGPVAITVNRHKAGGDISDQSAKNLHSGKFCQIAFFVFKKRQELVRHPKQYEGDSRIQGDNLGSRYIHAISGEQAATAAATANPIPLLLSQKTADLSRSPSCSIPPTSLQGLRRSPNGHSAGKIPPLIELLDGPHRFGSTRPANNQETRSLRHATKGAAAAIPPASRNRKSGRLIL